MIADLSHYQGTIDWEKASPHLDFVILRASVGDNKDQKYKEYTENCKLFNIPFGVYHYVKATNESEALKEAEHFYNTASWAHPLFYVADIEYQPTIEAGYDEIAFIFLQRLKELGAIKLGLYIPQRYYPKCILSQKLIDFNWIPRYGKNTGFFDPDYIPTCKYDLHQYTSKGYLDGTNGTVDLNRLSGSKSIEWFTTRKKKNDIAMEITKDNGGEIEESEDKQSPEISTPKEKGDYKVTGGSVWLWDRHPSYGGEKMLVVHRNDEFEAPDLGNYIPIIYNKSIKWINKKYIKEI